jgi:hypothetical protein
MWPVPETTSNTLAAACFMTVLLVLIVFYRRDRRGGWFRAIGQRRSLLYTGASARNPSRAFATNVLQHYCTLTRTAFDFAVVVVGRCTFSTPSRNSAVTFVLSVSSGSVKLRRKLP